MSFKIISVSPSIPQRGGTIELFGEDLGSISQVIISGQGSLSVTTLDGGKKLTATFLAFPPFDTGPQNVSVIAQGKTDITKFKIYVEPPMVSGFDPQDGALGGGTTMNIIGEGFGQTASVSFSLNGLPVATLSNPEVNPEGTLITGTTPAFPGNASGQELTVFVHTLGGSFESPGQFKVLPPVLELIRPSSGSIEGGYPFIIYGRNLTGVNVVQFANIPVSPSYQSSTAIKGIVPPTQETGSVPVIVVVQGVGSNTIPFDYTAE